MSIQKRIICPDYKLSKKKRVCFLFDEMKEWIYSDEFKSLLKIFNGDELANTMGKDFSSDITELKQFVSIWDYRGGKERWAVQDNEYVKSKEDVIMECAFKLGLKDVTTVEKEPDYVLPLGGARAANRVRPAMARKLIDDHNWSDKKVLALSGTRPISENERPYMVDYAQTAGTEYDAICSGLEIAFEVNQYEEEKINDENINSCSAIRKYNDFYKNCEIYSVAAPSSDPQKRRANSADTFRFFVEKFDVHEGDRLLLVTSCIYVPFQSLKFMDLAMDNGYEVDCVGSDIIDNFTLSKTSNYLQEIKGTIDAMYSLVTKYSMYL